MRTLVLSMILGLSLAGAPLAWGQNAPVQPGQPGQEQLLRVQKEAQDRLHQLKAEQARIRQQQQELEGLLKKVQGQLGTPPPTKKSQPPRPLGQAGPMCPMCQAQPGKPGMMMPGKPGVMKPGQPGALMGPAQEMAGRLEEFAKALKQAQASQMSSLQKELAEVREQWARQQREGREQLAKFQDQLMDQLHQMQETFTRQRLALQQQLEERARTLGPPQNQARGGESEALQRQVQALQAQVRELQAQVRQLRGAGPPM